MLSRADNEAISRIGPGTLMGDLMRQYWIPALLSSELVSADSEPVRVMLLGEQLIAFRDTNANVGLIHNNCPHRGASLFFGRNEEGGLRCVYHGWKFETSGACVDMPNHHFGLASEPAESDFRNKVSATAYPTRERGGVVWAYLGPRTEPPPLPSIEANMLPDDETMVWCAMRECNWLQALEGDIDTSHAGFLHLGAYSADDAPPGTFSEYALRERAPRYAIVDTDYGSMYGAYRPAEADTYYWRIAHWEFPFFTQPPVGVLGLEVNTRAWVPMDDEHTMFFFMLRRGAFGAGPSAVPGGATPRPAGPPRAFLNLEPNGTGWYDRFRMVANARNDYQVDRDKQRKLQSYTGIDGIHLQDQAVTESMGPIFDRSQEHLASADAMIIRTRRRLLDAARALGERGTTPPGVDTPEAYLHRPGGVVLPRQANWEEATESLRKAFIAHPELSRSATGGLPAI